ncbi:MAG: hypothetical protein ACTSQU_07000 [Promethearchaeota archaeon]
MSEIYENFMIFGLESTGEKVKLDISEDTFRLNNGQDVLDPNQVLIIVKEGLRRIYIWKGVNSHVRKKFIASRIAAELQNDLVVDLRQVNYQNFLIVIHKSSNKFILYLLQPLQK